MSEPKRSIKITNHFTCTSANVIYMSCITCTYCKKLYISETIRRLYTLIFLIILNSICQFAAFPYILAVQEAAKHQNKNLSSKSVLLILTVSTSAFHSTNLFLFSRHHIPTDNVVPFSAYKPTHNPQLLQSLRRRANARNVSL